MQTQNGKRKMGTEPDIWISFINRFPENRAPSPFSDFFKGQCGQAAVKAYHSRHAAAFMAREPLDSCMFSGEE
jgi:hypothetical protein